MSNNSQLENARDAAFHLLHRFTREDGDIVICANGSIGEGFSTPSSDYDFLILAEQVPESISPGFHTEVINEKRVEYRLISFEIFRSDIKKLRARFQQGNQSFFDIDYGHRLMRALPLVGEERYRDLVKDVYIAELKEAAIDSMYSSTLGVFDDLLGARGTFDSHVSALFARRYMQSCMDLLLAARGDTYIRGKWRALRSSRALGSDSPLHIEYMQRELFAGDNQQDLEKWILATMEFAHKLQLCSITFQDLSSPNFTEYCGDRKSKLVIAVPSFVVRLKRNFYIRALKKMHRIDQSMALVFLNFHTPAGPDLVKARMATYKGVTSASIEQMIGFLLALGLIKHLDD